MCFVEPRFCERTVATLPEIVDNFGDYFFLRDQRTAAALAALADLCSCVSARARAWPPFSPPRRPKATAAGFLETETGSDFVTLLSIEAASLLGSLGIRERLRFGMRQG